MFLSAALFAAVASAQPYAYIANIGGGTVSVINTGTHTLTATITVPGSPDGVAVTPNGAYVYIACQAAPTVSVISTASNSVVQTISLGAGSYRMALTPNGSQLYVTEGVANAVAVIDTASNSLLATIPVGSGPRGIAFSPDGSYAYVANQTSGNVSVISTASRSVVNTFPAGAGAQNIAVTPQGNLYVSNAYGNTVTVLNPSGAVLATIGGFTYPNAIVSTPNGSSVYVVNTNSTSVSVISTSSNSIVASIPVGSTPQGATISPDGGSVFVSNEMGLSLTQISVATNTVVNTQFHVGVYPFWVGMVPAIPVAGTGSGSGSGSCTTSFSSSSANMSSTAANSSVGINASASSCGWTLSDDSPGWLTVTSAMSGSGSTNVTFSVTANTGLTSRTGHITMGSQSYTITQAGVSFSPIRVNAGGPQVTDSNGNVWAADTAANYSATNAGIGGANPAALYQTDAWSTSTLQYSFSVPNGSHTVKLKFAEFYMTQRGQRVFNIVVNGSTFMSNFDILAYTSPNTAYDVSIPVSVTNGQILIQLVSVTGPAKVNGIEID